MYNNWKMPRSINFYFADNKAKIWRFNAQNLTISDVSKQRKNSADLKFMKLNQKVTIRFQYNVQVNQERY